MALKATMIGRNEAMKMLDRISPAITVSLGGMQLKVARDLAEKIRNVAPVRTGKYRDSINAARLSDRPGAAPFGKGEFNKTTDPNATGVFAAWYWYMIEFGTPPHTIRAKNAPRLVFEGREGVLKYMREVSHPGTTRYAHIFPIYRSEKKNMKRRMARAVNVALKKAIANQPVTQKDGEAA